MPCKKHWEMVINMCGSLDVASEASKDGRSKWSTRTHLTETSGCEAIHVALQPDCASHLLSQPWIVRDWCWPAMTCFPACCNAFRTKQTASWWEDEFENWVTDAVTTFLAWQAVLSPTWMLLLATLFEPKKCVTFCSPNNSLCTLGQVVRKCCLEWSLSIDSYSIWNI